LVQSNDEIQSGNRWVLIRSCSRMKQQDSDAFSFIIGMEFFGKEFLDPNRREKFVKLIYFSILAIELLFIGMFPMMSDNVHYFYSVFPSVWKNGLTWTWFVVVEGFVVWQTGTQHSIIIFIGFLHIFTQKFWMHECR